MSLKIALYAIYTGNYKYNNLILSQQILIKLHFIRVQ